MAAAGPIQALLRQEAQKKQQLRQRASSRDGFASKVASDAKVPRPQRQSVPSHQVPRRSSTPNKDGGYPRPRLNTAPPTADSRNGAGVKGRGRGKAPQEAPAKEASAKRLPRSGTEPTIEWNSFHRRSSNFLQERTALLDHLRAAKEEEQMQACTFAPTIKGGQRVSDPHNGGSLYERSRKHEERKAEKVAQMKQELFDQEMAQCSFKPDRSTASDSARQRYYGASQDLSTSSTCSVATSTYASASGARAGQCAAGRSLTPPRGNLQHGNRSVGERLRGDDIVPSSHESADVFSFTGEDLKALHRRQLLEETFALDVEEQEHLRRSQGAGAVMGELQPVAAAVLRMEGMLLDFEDEGANGFELRDPMDDNGLRCPPLPQFDPPRRR